MPSIKLMVTAALLGVVAALGLLVPHELVNGFNYDTALVIDRALSLTVASALAMSWIEVVAAAFVWNAILAVAFLNPTASKKWRHFFEYLLPKLPQPRLPKLVWALLAGAVVYSAWLLAPHALVIKLSIVAASGVLFGLFRKRVRVWVMKRPLPVQVLAVFAIAVAPAGIWINITILDGWKCAKNAPLARRLFGRWGCKASLVAVSSTLSCQLYQMAFGHPVKAGNVTAFQHGLLYGCRGLMGAVTLLLIAKLAWPHLIRAYSVANRTLRPAADTA